MNINPNLDTTDDITSETTPGDRQRKRRGAIIAIAALGAIAVIAGVITVTSLTGSDSAQVEMVETVQVTEASATPTTVTSLVDTTVTTTAPVPAEEAPAADNSTARPATGGGTPAAAPGGSTGGSTGGGTYVPPAPPPMPTTPPTTAAPLRITGINPGYAKGFGAAGPWQQAYCTYHWGLELSDGRTVWRDMTRPLPATGSWSTTLTSDPEFGAYPWGFKFSMQAQIVDGLANWLYCS